MKRASWGLTIAALGAGLAVALVTLTLPDNPVRAVVAVIFVIAAPGYTITEAILGQQSLDLAKRLALTVGLSLCAIIFIGLALNLTPWGLSQDALVLGLAAITLAGAAVAFAREYQMQGAAAPLILRLPMLRLPKAQLALRRTILLFLVALTITVAAVAVSAYSDAHQPYGGYTALWMLPNKANPDLFVELGIRNQENRPLTYRLVLNGGSTVLQTWDSLSLARGQTWQATVKLPRPASLLGVVTATLYRQDAPHQVYRYVVYHSGYLSGGSGAGGAGNTPLPSSSGTPTAKSTAIP